MLDLSDPTAPAVRGELKIPGYSTYMHLMDDDHVLAKVANVGDLEHPVASLDLVEGSAPRRRTILPFERRATR